VLVTVVNLAALTLLVLGIALLTGLLAGPAFGAVAALLAAGCALAVVGRALEVDSP
jgi:hypothetical protein